MARNQEFQEIATDELARRRLGPFAVQEGEEPSPLDPQVARERLREAQEALRPSARQRRPGGLARSLLILAGLALVTALGAHWEGGGLGLGARLVLHVWILAVVAGTLITVRQIRERIDHESFAFGVAFAGMVALGLLTDSVLRAFGGA